MHLLWRLVAGHGNMCAAAVQVACGGDVVDFCNTWTSVRAGLVLWGGYCILLSHLLMLQLLYQRGNTLALLLGLQRFEENLDGGGPDAVGASKRELRVSRDGFAVKTVGKGGVAWSVGKPTAADRLMSGKVRWPEPNVARNTFSENTLPTWI